MILYGRNAAVLEAPFRPTGNHFRPRPNPFNNSLEGLKMHIEDISITRSSAHARAWQLHIEVGGLTYDGWFDDFGGFLTAIQDAATFFAYRAGKVKPKP